MCLLQPAEELRLRARSARLAVAVERKQFVSRTPPRRFRRRRVRPHRAHRYRREARVAGRRVPSPCGVEVQVQREGVARRAARRRTASARAASGAGSARGRLRACGGLFARHAPADVDGGVAPRVVDRREVRLTLHRACPSRPSGRRSFVTPTRKYARMSFGRGSCSTASHTFRAARTRARRRR